MFGLGSWLRRRALSRAAIDEAAWRQALDRCQVASHLDLAATDRLRELVTLFLDRKQFTAAGGLELDDAMRLAIALQACVPILELGIESYDPWIEVIVYPHEFIVERRYVDDAGVVHEVREPLSGESWAGGPVVLSWADVEAALAGDPVNVVVHEFAHALDEETPESEGAPPMPPELAAEWAEVMGAEYARLRRHRRPPVLDAYGAESPGEFFGVVSESYFQQPDALLRHHPRLHRLLCRYYGLTPPSIQGTG